MASGAAGEGALTGGLDGWVDVERARWCSWVRPVEPERKPVDPDRWCEPGVVVPVLATCPWPVWAAWPMK